jgi:hypothetical protein
VNFVAFFEAEMNDRIRIACAEEIWMEDFRGSGSSCFMAAFSIENAPNPDDHWAPFKAAIGDGHPNYRGGILAAIEFHFVGCIKGRLVYASSRIVAPVPLDEVVDRSLVQITSLAATSFVAKR